jgi:hypothetical protein
MYLSENLNGRDKLGIPRCRWEDNIKMELKDTDCEYVE